VAAALAAGGGWALQSRIDRQQASLAAVERQLSALVEQHERRSRETALQIEHLETELARQREQREAVDALYQEMLRGRDETALIDVERLVTLAARELQVAGNLDSALAALQAADVKLARLARPAPIDLRRALARDIERLRAAPRVDLGGIAIQLDQVARAVDGLPLLAEARPPAAAKASAVGAAKAAAEPQTRWAALRAWLQREFGDLVRIRTVDTPEALLLDQPQQRLLRQQARLRLLSARTAALMRNDALYRADLAEAQALLARYFDLRDAAVVAAQARLRQLAAAPLSVELPQIDGSLAALRGIRAPGR